MSDSTPQHGVSTLQANGHLGEVASLLELPLSAGTSGLLFGGEGGFVSDWTPQHGVSTLQANGHLGEEASLLELPLSAGTSGLLLGLCV